LVFRVFIFEIVAITQLHPALISSSAQRFLLQ